MKLLHAADLHIDSPMRGLLAYEEAPVEDLRLATRVALSNLVDAAIEERVDALLLGGDIFDGDWHHYSTGIHFVSEMGRLREAEIPVVMIAGNHDADSKLTKSLPLPENVHVLDTRKPQTVVFDAIGLAVHGQGYATPAVVHDLSVGYPAPIADLINVGLLHTSADGRPGHEPYAPCTLEGLVDRGYDFWGLGHVHRHEVLSLDPLIVFPGNLQGRRWREDGPKGALLVQLTSDGSASFDQLHVDAVRWETLTIDAGGCSSRDDVSARVAAHVRTTVAAIGDRLLAARVLIEGVSEAHGSLASDSEALRYEVIATAADVAAGQVWVESVSLATAPPRELVHAGHDAVGELIQELAELRTAEDVATDVSAALAPMAKLLPDSVLAEFDPRDVETVAGLFDEISQSLPVALVEQLEA